jgi:hypothetical protein
VTVHLGLGPADLPGRQGAEPRSIIHILAAGARTLDAESRHSTESRSLSASDRTPLQDHVVTGGHHDNCLHSPGHALRPAGSVGRYNAGHSSAWSRNTFSLPYRDGGDVQARLPVLSTWLGHVDLRSTYWYLQAVPELLALAAARLEPDDTHKGKSEATS